MRQLYKKCRVDFNVTYGAPYQIPNQCIFKKTMLETAIIIREIIN